MVAGCMAETVADLLPHRRPVVTMTTMGHSRMWIGACMVVRRSGGGGAMACVVPWCRYEGAWTRTPSKWNYDYFASMLDGTEWVPAKSPEGEDQWNVKNNNGPWGSTFRLTADMAMVADPTCECTAIPPFRPPCPSAVRPSICRSFLPPSLPLSLAPSLPHSFPPSLPPLVPLPLPHSSLYLCFLFLLSQSLKSADLWKISLVLAFVSTDWSVGRGPHPRFFEGFFVTQRMPRRTLSRPRVGAEVPR